MNCVSEWQSVHLASFPGLPVPNKIPSFYLARVSLGTRLQSISSVLYSVSANGQPQENKSICVWCTSANRVLTLRYKMCWGVGINAGIGYMYIVVYYKLESFAAVQSTTVRTLKSTWGVSMTSVTPTTLESSALRILSRYRESFLRNFMCSSTRWS